MSKPLSPDPRERLSRTTSQSKESTAAAVMHNPDHTTATVSYFIEQLHADLSSPHEQELITTRLLGIARSRQEARILIASHSQAMPLFISILRTGTEGAKVNVAATLVALCKEKDLRFRVLLGGCIPPLLFLLKSKSMDARRAAAEAIFELSSGGLSDDNVGMKIFVTEGVVPVLWDQLDPKIDQDKVVEGFVTGALRNLCGDREGDWKATLDAGGVEIIISLLSSGNADAQSNAASLLSRLMSAFPESIDKVINAGAVEVLIHLMGKENEISVRARAADALECLSSKSTRANKAVLDANAIPILIEAVVAPSKQRLEAELGHALQRHAVHTLANIYGGMSALIPYLGELSQSPRLLAPVADIVGALSYALSVFEQSSSVGEMFDVKKVEDSLLLLLKPRDNKLVQERILEALASLYGNNSFSSMLDYAKTKRVMTGLIMMVSGDVQESLIQSLISFCCDGLDTWEALGKRNGIQLLISFLGISGERLQEHAVALLAILTDEVDDSKWAITAAGGIHPLVQLLEMGPPPAREDAAHVLWNLCCYGEDIRACVESAGAVPALLRLLASGGSRGQEASSRALRRLIRSADAATIDQLLAMLFGDSPTAKDHVVTVLGDVLTKSSEEDLVQREAPANKGLKSLIQFFNSANEDTQKHAGSVLADIFHKRRDICDSLETDEIVQPCMKLLSSKTPDVVVQAATAPDALSPPTKHKNLHKTSSVSEVDIKPLVRQGTAKLLISKTHDGATQLATADGNVNPLIEQGNVKLLISKTEDFVTQSTSTPRPLPKPMPKDLNRTSHVSEGNVKTQIEKGDVKPLVSKTPDVVTQSTTVPSALPGPTEPKDLNTTSYVSEGDVKPLIKMGNVKHLINLAKTSSMDAAETTMAGLANLLSDPKIVSEALAEDVVSALTRVLSEGSLEGKKNAARALHHLLNHFPVTEVLKENANGHSTVCTLADFLAAMNMEGADTSDALEVLALSARKNNSGSSINPPSSALAEVPSGLESLVQCLADGLPPSQDKAVEILSRLCGDQPVVLGDSLAPKRRSINSLADRIIHSSSIEVGVGGAALLVCAAKEHKQETMDALDASGLLAHLIYSLVDMMKYSDSRTGGKVAHASRFYTKRNANLRRGDDLEFLDPANSFPGTISLWLLAIISSFKDKYRRIVIEAGGVDVLSEMLASFTVSPQAEFESEKVIWLGAMLLAILFQDEAAFQSPAVIQTIPSLAFLLRSDKIFERFFAAQAICSLVLSGGKGIHLAIANSGAVGGLISLLGSVELATPNLVALLEEFSLAKSPAEVALEHLFEIEDLKVGSTARKYIPLLIDLLRPMPDKPGAPPIAVRLLTRIAKGSDRNKVVMAEAGALDALTKYLSLSPQDSTETTITDLIRILFSNSYLPHHETSLSALNQLIAVLHLGSRSSKLNAAKTLVELFDAKEIRDSEEAKQAIQPLVDMLNAASETEQHVALTALMKLISGVSSKASFLAEANPLESLCQILSSSASVGLKRYAAQLCYILFENSNVRSMPLASHCIPPLIALIESDTNGLVECGLQALERLLDNEQQTELAASHNIVGLLVRLISGSNYQLIEASIRCLIKLGKDRPHCKLDMIESGIVDKVLKMLPIAPSSLCSSIAELLRILTNNGSIARSPAAAMMVNPLFLFLESAGFSMGAQHSTLQALVNILEKKPHSPEVLRLAPSAFIEPLIHFLDSPSQAIQQLSTELLSHILEQEHFQQDITTKNAVVPLVHLVGIGRLNLQQTVIKALESISRSWPKAVADAGGIIELSKVILQGEMQPFHASWESAALVVSNILQNDSEYYFKVSPAVLVKMLQSTAESTIMVALNALIARERADASAAVLIADAGCVDTLLELLRSHQCEEASGRLLEALFNNSKVREKKASKYAIAPLSRYLLDPQTELQPAKLLATLALGDLFQHEGLARASDSVTACRALVNLLEEHSTEEMKMVAVCALQNLVMNSRTNRRAVAEAGGILTIQELLLSPDSELTGQAALLIKFLFSNHTLQEYVSNELIQSLSAALGKAPLPTATVNEEILRAINVIFTNFPKLHISEAATLCIPHLVGALKAGHQAAQESVLDTLCLLKHSWSTMPIDTAKTQAMNTAEAIPTLQLLRNSPSRFQEQADSLLHCLPGCLTVTIKSGNNLRQSIGSTNAFCRLKIGNGPTRQTKVVHHSSSPEWNEGFSWAFDMPPKGQKLHILCSSKNTFGKSTLGRVTIHIDRAVIEGKCSGSFDLKYESCTEASSRSLDIEILWSNRIPNDSMRLHYGVDNV